MPRVMRLSQRLVGRESRRAESACFYDSQMQDKSFNVRTTAREQIIVITDQVQHTLGELTDGDGICTIVTPHTTCAISVNENADPDVRSDLTRALRALVPDV